MADDDLHRLMLQRMDSQAEDIKDIHDAVREIPGMRVDLDAVKQQTTLTNGRVTVIELARATEAGQRAEHERLSRARQFWMTALIALISALVSGTGVFLASHL